MNFVLGLSATPRSLGQHSPNGRCELIEDPADYLLQWAQLDTIVVLGIEPALLREISVVGIAAIEPRLNCGSGHSKPHQHEPGWYGMPWLC